MKKAVACLGLGVLVVSLVLTSLYAAYQDLSFLGFDQPTPATPGPAAGGSPASPWRIVVLILSTLLGITGGYFHTRLQGAASQKFRIADEMREMLESPDYYRGLFASPIVFSVIYLAVNQQPDDVVAFLLAFENGFFWNRVLERRMAIAGKPA